jgi:hypothetical protein
MKSLKFLIFIFLLSFCLNATPLLGGWGEMEYYNKNISNVVSVCINDLNNNGYYNESYNFYPLVLFTQIVNGINFRLILAVQDAKSTNIRIFDYIVYSGFLNPNLTNIKIIKKNEIDYDSSYLDDKISNEKVKNAIAKFYYQKGKVEKYEIQYEFNTFNGLIGFKIYIVTVKVNYEENSKEENVIMVKREDKTFEVIAQLDME